MASQRYTISYKNRPAGQQVAGATLFFAAGDADAEAFLAVVQANMDIDNANKLNTAIAGGFAPFGLLPLAKEQRSSVLFDDGSLGFVHVPHVFIAATEDTLSNAVLGGATAVNPGTKLRNANGALATGIVRYAEVNFLK